MLKQHVDAYLMRQLTEGLVILRLREAVGHYRLGTDLLHDGRFWQARAEFLEASSVLMAFLTVWEDLLFPEQVAFLTDGIRESDRLLVEADALRATNSGVLQ